MADKTEVLFYQLASRTVEQTLPNLLEKTLSRGWRAVIQVGSSERLDSIDQALWTYEEDSFLPHGTLKDGFETEQPIYLTEGDETPNNATVRFLVDGAVPADFVSHMRLVFLFDGKDSDSKNYAQQQKELAEKAGCKISFWRQTDEGRWEKN